MLNRFRVFILSVALPFSAVAHAGPTTPEIKVWDGTNTVSVKPGSTAPVAGDVPMVVALHPSGPLPAGTNVLGAVIQGAAAVLSGAWPTKITDGTNTLPTMDVIARSGQVQINDGTNIIGSAAHPVVVSGTTTANPPATGTSAVTQVASSATNATCLASNSNRHGAILYNDSTQVLYAKLGSTASTVSYTTQVGPQAQWEIPFGYTGRIDCIWSSANGNAYATELTQ